MRHAAILILCICLAMCAGYRQGWTQRDAKDREWVEALQVAPDEGFDIGTPSQPMTRVYLGDRDGGAAGYWEKGQLWLFDDTGGEPVVAYDHSMGLCWGRDKP